MDKEVSVLICEQEMSALKRKERYFFHVSHLSGRQVVSSVVNHVLKSLGNEVLFCPVVDLETTGLIGERN